MEKTSVEPRLKRSIGSGLEGRGVVRTSRNRGKLQWAGTSKQGENHLGVEVSGWEAMGNDERGDCQAKASRLSLVD